LSEGGLKKEKLAESGRFLNPIPRPIPLIREGELTGRVENPPPDPLPKKFREGELCQSGRELIKN